MAVLVYVFLAVVALSAALRLALAFAVRVRKPNYIIKAMGDTLFFIGVFVNFVVLSHGGYSSSLQAWVYVSLLWVGGLILLPPYLKEIKMLLKEKSTVVNNLDDGGAKGTWCPDAYICRTAGRVSNDSPAVLDELPKWWEIFYILWLVISSLAAQNCSIWLMTCGTIVFWSWSFSSLLKRDSTKSASSTWSRRSFQMPIRMRW